MRKFFLIFLSLFFMSSFSFADDFLDVDYNFINSAFDGIKPVTNEEFEKTINKLTPKPVENTFGGKLKTFLFGRQYGVDPAPKQEEKEIDYGGEAKAISDIKNGIYYIKLIVSLKNSKGEIIPLGNYKIQEKTIEGQDYLVFYQGQKEYGSLKLRSYDDTKAQGKQITYSRVDIVNDDIVRIVYSTIKETKCAYGRIYKEN